MDTKYIIDRTARAFGLCLVIFLLCAEATAAAPPKAEEKEVSVEDALTQVTVEDIEKEIEAKEAEMKIAGENLFSDKVEYRLTKSAPVNDNYIIGPGDELIITLFGLKNESYRPVVDENGFVDITIEGENVRFSLNNVKFRDLREIVMRELAEFSRFTDPEHPAASPIGFRVTLGKIRGISIWVLGEVKNPRMYHLDTTISGVFRVLATAGGLTEDASRRNLMVYRRKTGETGQFDLHAFDLLSTMIGGKIDERYMQLEEGDVLYVPSRQDEVTLKGEVREPMRYELLIGKTTQTLTQMVDLAGGLTAKADPERVLVVRTKGVAKTENISVNFLTNPDFSLRDGDEIEFMPKAITRRQNKVTISGPGIRKAGPYVYEPGMTINDLIKKAGGAYSDAMLDRISFIRVQVDFSKYLSIKDIKTDGDFPLEPMDTLFIDSKFDYEGGDKFVTLKGHVKQAGPHPLAAEMKLSDVLFRVGGFGDLDFLEKTYLERGTIWRQIMGGIDEIPFHLGKALEGDPQEDQLLQSEDVIEIYSLEDIVGSNTITVIGHVQEPGEIKITKGLRISGLLFRVGGFKNADFLNETYLEEAELLRVNPLTHEEQIIKVNLRKIIEDQDKSEDILLQRLDQLTVYALEDWQDSRTVFIKGEVRSPGEYELKDNMLLADLLARANGLNAMADATRIEITRFPDPSRAASEAAKRIVVSVAEDGPTSGALLLRLGDHVSVRRKAEMRDMGTVVLTGLVAYPGPYVLLRHSETLSDVIERAGGLVESAAPEAVRILRQEGDLEVSINMAEALRDPHGPYDLALLDGDQIDIPKRDWTVRVEGEVLFPHALQYTRGASVSHYIRLSGGYADEARESATLIVYPNGDVKRARRWFFFTQEVQPGSRIIVPNEKALMPMLKPAETDEAEEADEAKEADEAEETDETTETDEAIETDETTETNEAKKTDKSSGKTEREPVETKKKTKTAEVPKK